MKLFKKFCALSLAVAMTAGILTVPSVNAFAAAEGTGGTLVHQEGYTGYKGTVKAYLSDLLDTDRMEYAHGNIETDQFTADKSFQGDGSKVYPIYLWNNAHSVNVVHPGNHPNGREITTMAEGTHTFMATDIVLGYTGKYFDKGLGGHLVNTESENYEPSTVIFDISGVGATRFYAVAGLTGDAANKPTTLVENTNDYGVTFAVYGSSAEEYADDMEFTLIASVDEIGGYGTDTANSKVYNTAEFNVSVSDYNFIKLVAESDGNAGGGSYAWGEAALFNPMSSQSTISSTGNFSGKESNVIGSSIVYLSSLTEESSYVVGYKNNVASPLEFYKDRSYPLRIKAVGHASDLDLLSFYAGTSTRREIYNGQSGMSTDENGIYRVENGVTYRPTTIALSYKGVVFDHGLSAIAAPQAKKPTSIVYDVSSLGADRFYSAVGLTSRANADNSTNYPYKLTFSVYGSKSGTADSDFELLEYVANIRAYLAGEIDVDISGYKYLKLETTTDAADNKINYDNSYQFSSGFAWADACVYKTATKLSNLGSSVVYEGHEEAQNVTYLSDVYSTNMVDSFVIGANSSETNPREYKLDTNWDNVAYVWTGTQSGRYSVPGGTPSVSPRTLTVTNADGTKSEVTYDRSEIVLGYRGTKFEKGLAALVSASTNKASYIVYDVRDLDADYFYAVTGLTGNANKNSSSEFPYKLTYTLYGSMDDTYTEDTEFEPIMYASDIRTYLTAEFKADISNYNFIKLETVSNGANSSGSFAWGGACVYSVEEPTPEPVNTMDRISVTVGSDLTLHVLANMADDVTAPTVRFSGINEAVTVEGTENGDRYQFDFAGVYSQFMSTTITMELLDDQEEVLETKTFSVADYCDTIHELGSSSEGLESLGLTAAEFAKLDTLLADMLEYGAAAQNYIDYNTDNLANQADWVAVSKTQSFTAPATDVSSSAHTTVDNIRSAALRLKNDVRFIIRVNAANATKLTVSAGGSSKQYVLADMAKAGTNAYVIEGDGMYATDFDTVYTFTLADDATTYHTVTYSVNSYVASKCASSDENLAAMVKAVYNYGVSADAYNN